MRRTPPAPPGYNQWVREGELLHALRELLKTPHGVLLVEGELKKARETFRAAYFPTETRDSE